MLKKLSIENYALIESLEIELPNGLVIITGETGAGKSILLGALSLLLGTKADSDVVLNKGNNCIVEGEFIIGENSGIINLLTNEEIDVYSDNSVILRRVVSPNGRSRAFINDNPVTLGVLTSVSEKLIDIHAQHQHLLLSNQEYQMSVLDYFSNSISLLEEYKVVNSKLNLCKSELNKINIEIERSNSELDYKQFQFERLEEAKLIDGELEELEIEHKQLANSEEIKRYTYESLDLLNNNEISILQNLKSLSSLLHKCGEFNSEYGSLAERIDSCRIECKDIERELSLLSDSIVISPQRLEIVEERLSLIYNLLKKYSVQSITDLISIKESLEKDLNGAEISLEHKEKLSYELDELTEKRAKLAYSLYELRVNNSHKLSAILKEKIRELEMPHAELEIKVNHTENFGSNGSDTIDFLFSANGNKQLTPIQKVASGGELSRIMLCIKSLMAEFTKMPTMIFDEIDTGVSGKIADKMGLLIGDMGQNMQIFAITHLPQIAAKGNTHLLVEKLFIDNKAKTNLKKLNADERIMEIARMLSGSELSKAAIENAKFLLKN